MPKESQLCECGCGEMAKPGNRYIVGHFQPRGTGWKHSEETKRKITEGNKNKKKWVPGTLCACGCGQEVTRYRKYISGHNLRGQEVIMTPERIQKRLDKMKDFKWTEEQKENLRNNEKKKAIMQSQEYKDKQAAITKAKWEDPDFRQTIEAAQKEFWGDPSRSDKVRQKMSDTHKEMWKDEEFAERMYASFNKKPTKPEIEIQILLDSLFPDEWKYVGDGKVWIDGKNPDFINCNGKKLIIEVFGDYWHRGENPNDRIETFKPFGYDTLVIWENEIMDKRNLDNLTKTITSFIEHSIK